MFSGLVEAVARIASAEQEPGGVRLNLECPAEFRDVKLRDSIAIQGCWLTVAELSPSRMVGGQLPAGQKPPNNRPPGQLSFQAGRETLSRTSLGRLKTGDSVNCERSLRLGDRLGGHLVTGHIDGLGWLRSRSDDSQWSTMVFAAPAQLLRQMASKGSITVDGVSLTLVHVDAETFSVALIPHTLANTTLGKLDVGDPVNLETDLLAKYVQRQLESGLLTSINLTANSLPPPEILK